MKIYLLLLGLLGASLLPGQVFIEVGPPPNPRDAFGSVIIYGTDGLAKTISYDRINGSPFWQDNWKKAYFFDHRNTSLGSYRAKFNFVTQEVHYLDKKGKEMSVIPGELNAVYFMQDDDSTKIASVFRANIPDVKIKARCKTCMVQELNQGDVKLLKITQRLLKTGDSLFGTVKRYYFTDVAEYFVQSGDQYHRIKRLNKETVLSYMPGASAYKDWIKEKGLSFKKESDYLLFIDYYNSTYKKE